MSFDNVWHLSTAQALAVASVGGAAASPTAAALLLLRTRTKHVLFNCRILVAGYFYPCGSLFCDALR